MDYLPLGKPHPVSPIIRGARFVLLFAGIIYGGVKQRKYEAMEAEWREEEKKRKVIRDREHAIMKARIAKEERETVKLLETGKLFDPPEELMEPKKDDPCKKRCEEEDDE